MANHRCSALCHSICTLLIAFWPFTCTHGRSLHVDHCCRIFEHTLAQLPIDLCASVNTSALQLHWQSRHVWTYPTLWGCCWWGGRSGASAVSPAGQHGRLRVGVLDMAVHHPAMLPDSRNPGIAAGHFSLTHRPGVQLSGSQVGHHSGVQRWLH